MIAPSFRRLALAGVALVLACHPGEPPTGVALTGVTLFDGRGGVQRNVAVVVRGTRIESIEPMESFAAPDRTRVVDLQGRWIIPGLIDAHTHVARWALPRYLAYGVTTVRDLHGPFDSVFALREELRGGTTAGPRLFAAGAMIDGTPASVPDAIAVTNGAEARKAVDRLVIASTDVVKLYTRITPAMFRDAADEAATLKVPVTAHLGLTDAITAAGFGARSLEHLSGVPEAAVADPAALYAAHTRGFFEGWTAFEKGWTTLDSAALNRVAGALAAKGVVLVPTLVLHETLAHLDDPALAQRADLKAVPDSVRSRWDLPALIARAGWGAPDFAAFRAARANQDLFLREFRGAGGSVVVGTDASGPMLIPGESVHEEQIGRAHV